jgi:2-iminoacetate synthase ThiH
VRKKISHDKADADRYLAIHKLAHRLGLRTNVTMLYGHIETMEERVDHMIRARALQDETGGSRRSSRWRSTRTTIRCASCRRRRPATRCAFTRWRG